MPYLKLDDIDLYYEVRGEGIPLLLIAGLASDSQSWQPVMEYLCADFLVITPDNRGTGRTQPQDIDISINHIANDCMALIDHLNQPSVNVLGHSMGGFVALDIAIRYPGYVDKLILASTAAANSVRNNSLFYDWAFHMESGMKPDTWFRNLFYWLFTDSFFENKTQVDEAIRYAVQYPYPQSPQAFFNQVNAIADYDCISGMSTITAETMVIIGKEDLLYPPEVGLKLAEMITHASSSVIDRAAHSIHMEQPLAFTRVVKEFMCDE